MEPFRISKKIILSLIVCYFSFFSFVYNVRILTLTNNSWTLSNSSHCVTNGLSQPSGIITDLTKARVLNESIYYRFNDVNYRWVAHSTWIYSLHFAVKDFSNTSSYEIIFHGLDGIASITLNGKLIGNANNTFVRYRFDVTKLLSSENDIEIKFEPPIESANRLSNTSAHPVPPSCVPPNYHGECHVNFLRRMQASFGWDWGLAALSIGIWKPIELVTYQNDLLVRDVTITTISETNQWRVNVTVFCEGSPKPVGDIVGKLNLNLSVKNEGVVTSAVDISFSSKFPSSEHLIEGTLLVPNNNVDLWWPNGYGDQPLYALTASLEIAGNIVSEKMIKIGFRTITLVQEAVNKKDHNQGLTFFFKVNGVKIFSKGTNYIPANILPEQETELDTIKHLLWSSKLVHMNMIRVWGGGRYENEYFYELCDEYGIMVWQDMMFACSMYPVDEPFLNSVIREVTQQIRRIQYHPCIALWAGNNENEAALSGNWYNTGHDYSLFKAEYVKLYVTEIRKIILSLDKTRYYAISSPSNGLKTEQDGYVSSSPYDPKYGDVHFYDYLHNSWLIDNFPMTRFASEYGFQSMASLSTWREIATEEDLSSLTSPFLEHRQHLPIGNIYLVYLMFFHFGAPDLSNIPNMIYLSQINQAMSVKAQTEWYRKWKDVLLPNGEGNTMGAMYWQLNDVWQTMSWSSVEFGGKWKMLHYYARHFFAPTIVTIDQNNDSNVTINVISDLLQDIPNAILQYDLYKWNSSIPVSSWTRTVTIKAEKSQLIEKTNVKKLIESYWLCRSESAIPGDKCFLKLTLKQQNGSVIHQNFFYPISFKKIWDLPNCDIRAVVLNCSTNTECDILLKASSICLFVWLDVGGIRGYFSDNGFTMTETERLIRFNARDSITSENLQNSLIISVLDKQRLDESLFDVDPITAIVTMFDQLYSFFNST